MKVILDTNVVISAVYFGGAPLKILKAWRDGLIELVVTDDILAEYDEIANRLHVKRMRGAFAQICMANA